MKEHAEQAAKQKKNKQRKHQESSGTVTAEEMQPPTNALAKHTQAAIPIPTLFSLEHDSPVSSTVYVGLRDEPTNQGSHGEYSLKDLVRQNSRFKFDEIEWDGKTPMPILDSEQRLSGLLAGRPDDPQWDKCHRQGCRAISKLRSRCAFTKKQKKGRRGPFPALNVELSHGSGQKRPGNLIHNEHNQSVLNTLTMHPTFQRMSGFTTGV
ncbi:hypothetical protein VKT23_016665 [Stygiomarasmius scandens]|uniref:Uncharacterized protein n=1 Tax=Marasmiellus scandens TaxID=2682957 RepID=A0ABR1IYK9_9AGAR